MEALGYPAGEPEVLLGQLVKLERGGELVRLSKRAGNIITLADILDEVDPDVARLTFLLQSIDTQQTFDLDLVTSQSMENPVYYVQYAHARIASIGRRAAERGVTRLPILDADLAPLTHDRELELLRALAAYPDVVAEAAALRAPHRITTWVRDFAKEFHGFYRDCRVISDDIPLTQARLWLAEACRLGLASALAILGVHAPDEMHRLSAATTRATSSMPTGRTTRERRRSHRPRAPAGIVDRRRARAPRDRRQRPRAARRGVRHTSLCVRRRRGGGAVPRLRRGVRCRCRGLRREGVPLRGDGPDRGAGGPRARRRHRG